MAIENPSRRQLLRGQFLQSLHSESAKIQGINAIRPPWSINEADFTDKCTAVVIAYWYVKPKLS